MAKRKDFFSEGGDCCEVLDVVVINASDFSSDDTYSIKMYNDKYTTYEFVVDVLMDIFDYNYSGALCIIEKIEAQGSAIVATYSSMKEAEEKVAAVKMKVEASIIPQFLTVEIIQD